MADHPSALKRHRQSVRRHLRNQAIRSRLKTELKKLLTHLEEKDLERVREQLRRVKSLYQRAGTKGVIPERQARRILSRVTTRIRTVLGVLSE
jgi:small subunit ribosomal protein S20